MGATLYLSLSIYFCFGEDAVTWERKVVKISHKKSVTYMNCQTQTNKNPILAIILPTKPTSVRKNVVILFWFYSTLNCMDCRNLWSYEKACFKTVYCPGTVYVEELILNCLPRKQGALELELPSWGFFYCMQWLKQLKQRVAFGLKLYRMLANYPMFFEKNIKAKKIIK